MKYKRGFKIFKINFMIKSRTREGVIKGNSGKREEEKEREKSECIYVSFPFEVSMYVLKHRI